MHYPPSDPEFQFAVKIDQRVDDLVRRPSVQIFAANREALRQHGDIFLVDGPPIVGVASGTLFRIANHHFIVTAAHVVGEFCEDSRELRVGVGNPPRPRPLPITDENSAVDAQNDVAVIRLVPDAIPHFVGSRSLGLSDVAFDGIIEEWRCVIFGCLWEGTQPGRDYSQLLVHNFKYWTTRYEGKINAKSYDGSKHLLVEYDRMGFSVPHSIPTKNPQSLGGMSGASLWRVFTPQHIEDGWSAQVPKVVAIENLVYDRERPVIRCTRWKHVLPLFGVLEPSVRAQLEPWNC
jgi:hypothetical protein